MATFRPAYTASTTITISPQNVASSAQRTAGVESTVISNLSNLFDTVIISGKWTAGTSPTANTQVDLWIYIPESDDLSSTVVYPDPAGTIDGTASAETITSENVRNGALWHAASQIVDSTSNRGYSFKGFSLKGLLRFMPTRWGLFISHDTGVNSNSTAGNHAWSYIGVKFESV